MCVPYDRAGGLMNATRARAGAAASGVAGCASLDGRDGTTGGPRAARRRSAAIRSHARESKAEMKM